MKSSKRERMVWDASAIGAVVLGEPEAEALDPLLRRAAASKLSIMTAAFCQVEVANAVWKASALRGLLTASQAEARLARLIELPIVRIQATPFLERSLRLAGELLHPVYDTLYLAIAQALSAPLLTYDESFRNKTISRVPSYASLFASLP